MTVVIPAVLSGLETGGIPVLAVLAANLPTSHSMANSLLLRPAVAVLPPISMAEAITDSSVCVVAGWRLPVAVPLLPGVSERFRVLTPLLRGLPSCLVCFDFA